MTRVTCYLLLISLALAGCASVPAPPPGAALMAPAADGVPPLLTVAGWANHYGWSLVPGGVVGWRACYPVSGAPVERFVWEFKVRRSTPAAGVPFEDAMRLQLYAATSFYSSPVDHDSVLVRIAGVDALERQGPWSPWGALTDTTTFGPCAPFVD